PHLPPVLMHLHKEVPMGAGLGGGSADGAATLKMLNHLGNLGLSEQALLRYAARLGSDCPFFIKNQPQIAWGRGEQLSPLPFDIKTSLKNYCWVLVCPMKHVPTAVAFSQITPKAGPDRAALADLLQ